jgi:hypothetical protein
MTPQLARQIAQLVDDGLTAAEVADRLALPRTQVIRIAARTGLRLGTPGLRRIGVALSPERCAVIRSLAREAGIAPSTMLARIAGFVVDDGPEAALRRLGRHAQPKRTYRRAG